MRAFTLLELIIVLVIIGIVAAIGLPGINKARLDAEIEGRRAFAVQLQTAKLALVESLGRDGANTAWTAQGSDELKYDNLLKTYMPANVPADLSILFKDTVNGYVINLGNTIDLAVTFTKDGTNISLYKY